MRLAYGMILAAGLGLLPVAVYRAVRLAYADHLYRTFTPASVRRAIRLAPGRALYEVGLAELLERAGQDSRSALRRAAVLSPDDAAIRIRLGLALEIHGDVAGAERELLAAARVSQKYDPRWSLANFYFRRRDEERFWHWAREALRVSYGDRTPLLELCWRMAPSAETILCRAIPDRRPVRLAFADFVLARREFAAAEALVTTLAAEAAPGETRRFLQMTDRLLAAGRFPAAITVWNSLCRRRLLPYPALDARHGPVLTNGDFARPFLGRAFDWRSPATDGAFLVRTPPNGVRVILSGRQPVSCEILQEYLPLRAGADYELRYRYRVTLSALAAPDSATGLFWRVYGLEERPVLIAESEAFASEGVHQDRLQFRAPDGIFGGWLVLQHWRQPGHTRMEGTVLLEGAELKVKPAGAGMGRYQAQ